MSYTPYQRLAVDDSPNEPRSTRCSSSTLLSASFIAFAVFSVLIGLSVFYNNRFIPRGVERITMDQAFNGTWNPERKAIHWLHHARDGTYGLLQDGVLQLVDLSANTTTDLVSSKDITDEHGNTLQWSQWSISPSMRYLLVKADMIRRWHRSTFGNYYIHDLKNNITYPLVSPTHSPQTNYAVWSPTEDAVAYVHKNDVYILKYPFNPPAPIRVTTSGSQSTLFNGVPDWVYEEEVLFHDYALWWSPGSSGIAFISFNDTGVDEYTLPLYTSANAWNESLYPSEFVMRYPAPGQNNPTVSVHIFSVIDSTTVELDWENRLDANESVVFELAWIDDSTLILKEVNRNADDGNVVVFRLDASESPFYGRIVRRLGRMGPEGNEGWIDSAQAVYPLPPLLSDRGSAAYLDIVPTRQGYNHIALFTSAEESDPVFLTSGDWEVTGNILGVNSDKRLVYFQAAHPTSIQRHIYAASIPLVNSDDGDIHLSTPLTDIESPSFFHAEFSPGGGFFLLSYDGPDVPWQHLRKSDDPSFIRVLEENTHLRNMVVKYEAPDVVYTTVVIDGYELNVKEMRPPQMDYSGRTKYPLLFSVSGAPTSQMVNLLFRKDWEVYLVCHYRYIVVVVDGRGTAYNGRKLRNPVKNKLGFWEARDQIEVARVWAKKQYVDTKRIGIWGWSYGGYISSKVVEADAGVHSLAMAIAPVVDWRLYDSIFTERYMNTPARNPEGYAESSIHNATAFRHVDYLLAHGSADLNVHFSNSAHLLDMFTQARIRGYSFRMFTNSDHAMRGAYREVFEYMTLFLTEKWGGDDAP